MTAVMQKSGRLSSVCLIPAVKSTCSRMTGRQKQADIVDVLIMPDGIGSVCENIK